MTGCDNSGPSAVSVTEAAALAWVHKQQARDAAEAEGSL